MIGQVTGLEQPAAGFFERVMQPLPRGPVIRAERVVRAAGRQRGEHGLPDRLAGRGQLPVQQPGRIGQPGQDHPPVGLLLAFLGRARAVRVQVGQDPLTQQPDRARIDRAGMLQQRRLHRSSVLGAISSRDRLDRVRDRRRMLRTNRTVRESSSNSRVNRLQRFAGQRPPGTEPLHRLRPTPSLNPSTPNLRGNQISQPTQPQLTRHVPSVAAQPTPQAAGTAPEHSSASNTPQLSQQLRIGSGSQRLDHMFDSTVQAKPNQSSTSRKPI